MKNHSSKGQFRAKVLLWVAVVACYMAFLAIISHARGPQPYELIPRETLTPAAFTSFDGSTSGQDALPFQNNTDGNLVGYTVPVSLQGLHGLQISFEIDCQPEDSGSVLYVDFYNPDENYDDPSNEFQVTLQEGKNEVTQELYPGDTAPQSAQLRLFTLNSAHYEIRQLSILEQQPTPKVSTGMIVFFTATVVLLIVTIIWILLRRKGQSYE